jgi:hypothetical protein
MQSSDGVTSQQFINRNTGTTKRVTYSICSCFKTIPMKKGKLLRF